MSTDESEVERHAGIDMVPIGESFETNSGPDDGTLGPLASLWTQQSVTNPSRDRDDCF
jgi:hypothetical protein